MNSQPDRPDPGSETSAAEADDPDRVEEQAGEAEAGSPAAEEIAALKASVDENWDKYLRAAAELDNVRKRAARDVDNARKFALERFCTELLAVRDSLEMGLAAAGEAEQAALREGSEATLKILTTTMERFGVVELDPQGAPFDPQEHEAMTMQASADAEPGSVLTVIQKGYLLNGRLLRPARVIVASEPPEGAE